MSQNLFYPIYQQLERELLELAKMKWPDAALISLHKLSPEEYTRLMEGFPLDTPKGFAPITASP